MIPSVKERSKDRVIVLRPKEGKKPISTSGLFDPRLFTGENKLHAIQDPKGSIWSLKYEAGGLQEPLKQRFTSFDKLLDTVRKYYLKRNIEITEVID